MFLIPSAGPPAESLDELTSMVVQLFGEVENKNVPVPEFPEHPFQEEQLKVSVEGSRPPSWRASSASDRPSSFLRSNSTRWFQ